MQVFGEVAQAVEFSTIYTDYAPRRGIGENVKALKT